jgi:hypothetical protein
MSTQSLNISSLSLYLYFILLANAQLIFILFAKNKKENTKEGLLKLSSLILVLIIFLNEKLYKNVMYHIVIVKFHLTYFLIQRNLLFTLTFYITEFPKITT